MKNIKVFIVGLFFLVSSLYAVNVYANELEIIHQSMHKVTAPISLDYDIKEEQDGAYSVVLSIKSLVNQQLEVQVGQLPNVEIVPASIQNITTDDKGNAFLNLSVVYNESSSLRIPVSVKVLSGSKTLSKAKYVRNFMVNVKSEPVSKLSEKPSLSVKKVVLPLERQ